jgi:hypothetical protein
MTLRDLLLEFSHAKFIPYAKLLLTDEWQRRREEIVSRDNHKCIVCGVTKTIHLTDERKRHFHVWVDYKPISELSADTLANLIGKTELLKSDEEGQLLGPQITIADKHYHLEVHHKCYILNRLPWQYEDTDLCTVCNWCHLHFHQQTTVPIYSADGTKVLTSEPCLRCSGAGWFPEYKHVYKGICFRCDGARFEQRALLSISISAA